jgi:hypothetical protein
VSGVPLDTKLNLFWAALSIGAFVTIGVMESRLRRERIPLRALIRRLVCVLVLNSTVFPSISSSDDLLSFSFFQFPINGHGGLGSAPRDETREKANLHLARLLQMLQSVQVARSHTFRPIFGSATVSFTLQTVVKEGSAAGRLGRAPPKELCL